MRISSYDPQKLENAYGILCRAIHSQLTSDFVPFGLVFCKVLPNTSTAPHQHHENEAFVIVGGKGTMKIGEETAEIQSGDVVFIPARSEHELSNSGSEDLDFYSIYWTVAKELENDASIEFVIPAPPTPNGSLHLGHLSGPYLAADVAHRAAVTLGKKSLHVMGTDDFQSYVGAKAWAESCSQKDILDKFVPQITQVIKDFGNDVSYFLKPFTDCDYKKFIQEFYLDLKQSGIVKTCARKAPRCISSNVILYGSAIEGKCPNCKEITGGNGCENCGYYNDAWDLIEATSTIGNDGIDYVDVERGYVDLEQHRDFLENFIENIAMPSVMMNFYRSYLQKKLPIVSTSQPAEWGISAPGEQGHVVYEWCEMAGGFLYLVQKMKQQYSDLDFSNSKVNLAFGFDNAFFYGLLVPVLLKDKDICFQSFLTNYFLHLDGQKFSTSRNHAIWGRDVLDKVRPDLLRMYLCLVRSELTTTNYRATHFRCFLEQLIPWDELLQNMNKLITEFPIDSDVKMGETEERFLYYFNRSCSELIAAYNIKAQRLNDVARHFLDMTRHMQDFYHNGVVNCKQNLHLLLLALRRAAQLWQPVMPDYSNELLKCFAPDLPDVRTPITPSLKNQWQTEFSCSFVTETLHCLDG